MKSVILAFALVVPAFASLVAGAVVPQPGSFQPQYCGDAKFKSNIIPLVSIVEVCVGSYVSDNYEDGEQAIVVQLIKSVQGLREYVVISSVQASDDLEGQVWFGSDEHGNSWRFDVKLGSQRQQVQSMKFKELGELSYEVTKFDRAVIPQ